MIFTLEPLQASEGDCLLLHWSDSSGQDRLAVIDGGPGRTYEDSLKPRLNELRGDGDSPLTIDLAMVSHMDSDHIVGIKKLLSEVRKGYERVLPDKLRLAKVNLLWFNVFNDVLGDRIDKYYKKISASIPVASTLGEVNPVLEEQVEKAFVARHGLSQSEAAFNAHAVAGVLAGYGDGRTLRSDYEELLRRAAIATLNAPFSLGGKPSLLTAERTPKPIDLDGINVQIIGPQEAEIVALQAEFDKYIEENGLSTEAVLAAYADKSAKNLSSIVCVVSAWRENTQKTILLTGDARGDYILQGLEGAGLVAPGRSLQVDVLKVPHHGSDRNVTAEFFERITADHYILSGNGKHGNPDRATLQWIVDSRADHGQEYHVYLTYSVADTDMKRREHHEKKGGTWSQAKHSLRSLIDEYKSEGHLFKLHEAAPFKIDLGGRPAWR